AVVALLGGSGAAMLFAALTMPWIVGIVVDRLVLARRALRMFNEAVRPGLEAISRGRIDEAEAVFRALLVGSRSRRGLQGIALFNIAAARTRRGDSMGALRILLTLHAYAGTRRVPTVKVRIPLTIALHWAQIGDTIEARRWLQRARSQATAIKLYTGNVEAL